MTDPIEAFLDSLRPMFVAVNEILDAWTADGCMQVPSLLLTLTTQLNWDDKQVRANDPLIRAYIKSHPAYDITRGAHGGIVRRAEQEKKRADLIAKASAKAKAKAEIEAVLNAKTQAAATPDNTNS